MKQTFLQKFLPKPVRDVLLYLVAFLGLQGLVMAIAAFVIQSGEMTPMTTSVATLVYSIAAIALFAKLRWAPCSGKYINKRPWFTLFWVVFLTIGCMLPVELITEIIGVKLPDEYVKLFSGIMSNDLGFIAIGIVAPVAEEMLFRGAILRTLLSWLGYDRRWIAIVVSALLFGVVHGNMAQGLGAFLMGLLIGWMYMRTQSMVPGILFHWVNNSLAVMMFRIMPQAADMTVIDYFHGDMMRVGLAALFSLMIFGASLYQLRERL